MAEDGYEVSPEAAERLLDLHRVYLEAPPPDRAGSNRDGYDDGMGAAVDGIAADEGADPPPAGEG
jgi:hypothetical protein